MPPTRKKATARYPRYVLSACTLQTVLLKEEGWEALLGYLADARISAVTLASLVPGLGEVQLACTAVGESLRELDLTVSAFEETDAYWVCLLSAKAPRMTSVADLAAISLAIRLDGEAVFADANKAGLADLSPVVVIA